MTIYLIIFIVIIVTLIFKSNWKLRKKIISTLLFIILFVIGMSLLFVFLWNSSKLPHETEVEKMELNLKTINLYNAKNEKLDISVDFEYSKEEILEKKLKIIDYYNTQSVFFLNPKSEFLITLPIPIDEKILFPKKFSIVIKDSLRNIIKKYDQKTFFENAKSEPMIKNKGENYKAKKWSLIL